MAYVDIQFIIVYIYIIMITTMDEIMLECQELTSEYYYYFR